MLTGSSLEGMMPWIVVLVPLLIGIGVWVGHVNSDRERFKDFMKEVREDISGIRKDISGIFLKLKSDTITPSSPIKLTQLGQSISAELESRTWARETAPTLVDDVTGKHPYEIQNFCFEYVRKDFLLPEEMDEKVKNCAYKNGITREEVLQVLAIELRDDLLARLWK